MRWLKRIFVALVVLVLGASAFLFWTVRRSFPQVDGEVTVSGLEHPVTVHRDDWGIPHIMAETSHDLFFAQGYVHAQERFWQMDFWRHIGSGRLSELFGESQVGTDRFLRSLGFVELARQELALMDPNMRRTLDWYAEGVNAYLTERRGVTLSLEYGVLGLQNRAYEIEPWDPIHTLTWAKLMSWDLSGNLYEEVERAILSREIRPERLTELYPPYPADRPVIVESWGEVSASAPHTMLPDPALRVLSRAAASARRLHDLTGGGFDGIGSNSWVVDGTRTTTGAPILANDTHLAPQMPAIWFMNGLHCVEIYVDCPDRMVGLSFAGAPGIVVGHNGHHAWGVTTQAVDTQDLFVERLDPEDPTRYEANGEWVPFETRTETIRVAGGEDQTLEVRTSRHGPIISGTYLDEDAFAGSTVVDVPDEYAVALSWATLEPSTLVESIIGISRAGSYDEFVAAAAKWDIAAQNLVYADVDGNIAYQSTGRIPVRASGDGRQPVPGWTSEFDWVGYVPFEDMPRLSNPEAGIVVTANNPVVRPGSLPAMGETANKGLRAARILSLLESRAVFDAAAMRSIQLDTFDSTAATVVPYLLAVEPGEAGARRLQGLLREWAAGETPYMVDGESAGAAAWMGTWRHLLLGAFADELPEDYLPWGGDRWALTVTTLLDDGDNPWWDDTGTPAIETRDEVIAGALRAANTELTELMGDNPTRWTWGRLHVARFRNQSFGESGIGPIEWLFNRTAPARVGGTSGAINAVGWNTAAGYEVDWIPSFRMVIDLDDLSRSTFIHSTGQSGHAFHQHYDDMIEPWADGLAAPMIYRHAAIESSARNTLLILPAG